MIPKKLYLNYVNDSDFENDVEITWSEEPVDVAGCKMLNREYTDLSQVWHHHSIVPTERNKNIIYITTFDEIYIEAIPRCLGGKLTDNSWNDFAMRECVIGWAAGDDRYKCRIGKDCNSCGAIQRAKKPIIVKL